MAKITWADKTAINPQPSIARENKCTNTDLNEIKSVVNTNDDNVGDLSNLNTTDKTSIVGAINEIIPKLVPLWTGSNNTIGASLPLSDSVENYDFILLTATMFAHSSTLVPVEEIEYGTTNNIVWNVGPLESSSVYSIASVSFSNSTTAYIQNIHHSGWNACNITGIYGIKL